MSPSRVDAAAQVRAGAGIGLGERERDLDLARDQRQQEALALLGGRHGPRSAARSRCRRGRSSAASRATSRTARAARGSARTAGRRRRIRPALRAAGSRGRAARARARRHLAVALDPLAPTPRRRPARRRGSPSRAPRTRLVELRRRASRLLGGRPCAAQYGRSAPSTGRRLAPRPRGRARPRTTHRETADGLQNALLGHPTGRRGPGPRNFGLASGFQPVTQPKEAV